MSKQIMVIISKGQRGSAIVGVLVLAIIMAIGSIGYLQVAATSANNEIQALNDAKAFHAAESGLLLGSKWVKDNWASVTGTASNPFGTSLNGINGMNVTVTAVKNNNTVTVSSVAQATSSKTLAYQKSISWVMAPGQGNAAVGTIINDLSGVPSGISGINIDGSVHVNQDIVLAAGGGQNKNFFKNGTVTVHSSSRTDGITNGAVTGQNRGTYTNNYRYGIHRYNSSSLTAADCDTILTNKYLSHQDSLMYGYTVNNSIDLGALYGASPASGAKNPVINFLATGGATYQYFSGGAWLTATLSNISGKALLLPNNVSVNVYGTIQGNISVITQGAADIHVVGELTYASGFAPNSIEGAAFNNVHNYGITGTDLVSLFSNRDLIYEGKWWSPTSTNKEADFIKAPSNDGQNTYLVGFTYAKGKTDMNNFSPKRDAWYIGARSTGTFGEHFWDRGNDYNPYMLYDSRFGSGAVSPAGVTSTITHYDYNGQVVNVNSNFIYSQWQETNS